MDLRWEIKNLYPDYKVKLITIVFDYLGVYNKDLDKELNILFWAESSKSNNCTFPEVGYFTEL